MDQNSNHTVRKINKKTYNAIMTKVFKQTRQFIQKKKSRVGKERQLKTYRTFLKL